MVALLAEGVDRNHTKISDKTVQIPVALLAEGVDRNHCRLCLETSWNVALLAEGVDRNTEAPQNLAELQSRPPRGGRG